MHGPATTDADRQAREIIAAYANERVYQNPWIPTAPHPKQLAFLLCNDREALYGGAAGGGKSEALLAGAAMFLDVPGYAAILFRRTHTDLAQPGALLDRSHEWWHNTEASWDGTNKIWRFPSGAKVALAYLKNPNDHLRYQSAEYQYVAFDELTQFPEVQYRYVGLSRMRRVSGMDVPLRLRSGTNPGGPGHTWVRERFILPWRKGRVKRPFFPATIDDNPSLNREEYIASLLDLHPTVREQLLRGDWDVRDPGDYFRREWFGPMLPEAWPSDQRIAIRWWDLAGSERPEDEKGMRSRTAGVRVAKHLYGAYAVEHALAFWRTPGARDNVIIQTAQADGYDVAVGIEVEPGSGGKAQAETLERKLRRLGYKVALEPATARKEERADPIASELERGWSRGWEWPEDHPNAGKPCGVRIVAGPWTNEYLDEVEGFPDVDLLDMADATASAFNWLRPRMVRAEPAGQRGESRERVNPDDVAGDDESDADGERMDGLSARRRWRAYTNTKRASGRRRW